MNQPDLLISRILKVRYFPNGSFLDAHMGASPSYAWRSILEGKKTLKKGLVWRVGNGFNINIWKDPWLSNNTNFKVTTPVPKNASVSKVHQLILEKPPRRNVQLLSTIFSEQDREDIEKIPLTTKLEDEVYWIHGLNGIYIVKSGYKWNGKQNAITKRVTTQAHQACNF